jgi:hypothetical protein
MWLFIGLVVFTWYSEHCFRNWMFPSVVERWVGGYFSLCCEFRIISYWRNLITVNYSSMWLIDMYSDEKYLFWLKSLFLDCIDHEDGGSKLLWNISRYLPIHGILSQEAWISCYILCGMLDNRQSAATLIIGYHHSQNLPCFVSEPCLYLHEQFFVIHFNISFPSIHTKVWLLYNE